MPPISGYRHVSRTVTDLDSDKSSAWYTEVMGFTTVMASRATGSARSSSSIPRAASPSGSSVTARAPRGMGSTSSAPAWTT